MKRWMKKVVWLFLCLILVMNCSGSIALADVIVPPNDDFYLKHEQDCKRSVRSYIANSENGYVYIYRSPESKQTITYLVNQTKVTTTYTYVDSNGVEWAITEDPGVLSDGAQTAGWIRLDEFDLVYDHEEFLKDHQDEIIQEEIEWDLSTYTDELYLWTYPNSGKQSGKIDPTTDYAASYSKTYNSYYQDESGNRWVYIGYYMIMKGWICIDQPDNASISEIDTTWEEKITWYEAAVPDPMNTYYKEVAIVGVLVIAVAVVTAVMIRIIYKKEQKH